MPRPDVSEQRKAQILDAAAHTFSRLGYAQSRMDDVAAAAGLSKGTLYLYFASKEALLDALLHGMFAQMSAALERLRAPDTPAADRLLAYAEAVFDEFERLRPFYPLIYEAFSLASRQAPVRAIIEAYFAEYRAALTALIADGVQRGELRTDAPEAAATSLIAAIDGVLLLAAVVPAVVDVRAQGMQAVRALLNGLLRG